MGGACRPAANTNTDEESFIASAQSLADSCEVVLLHDFPGRLRQFTKRPGVDPAIAGAARWPDCRRREPPA
jgi:hypothetical protein